MPIVDVKLEDKYVLNQGRAFMTGFQALVRLPMMQRQRDLAAGLNTAGFVSGYPGSPISALDTEMKRAERFLKEHHVEFQPGLNEDLAATAVWGTQQVNSFRGARYDGVFAMWFGKGPGVDRTGDVFVHGNTAGTSPHGGVLAIAGDDHAARTTTTPHQSELIFASHQMPVLNPATSQDFLDLGLHGWALSRYSGLWVGILTGCDNVERSGSLYLDPHRVEIRIPDDFEMPAGGLSIRWPYPTLQRESTIKEHSLFAALAYARANKLNRVVVDSQAPRFGVAATGKSYTDLREAMGLLGIDDAYADELGLRVFRIDMTWPLEPQGVVEFARGLEEVLVIEEKRPFVETQIKEQLFNWDHARRPRVIGKYDGHGEWEGPSNDWLLPSTGELDPVLIARILADRIARFRKSPRIDEAVARLDARDKALEAARRIETHGQTKTMFTAGRLPYFCSGCPHNTSTKVPEGSRALAGIGCHFMAMWMNRSTTHFSQMGGEGVAWIGQSPFTDERHVFANLGDGTYLHSGLTAIRAAVAAGANITYKILLNGAISMTGGQALPMELTADQISRQLSAEGVGTIVVVSDEPDKYPARSNFAPGVTIRHRRELEAVQVELRDIDGVTAIIYDQGCAAEKRRARKRGKLADQAERVVINEAVCEGCGDCSVASNCLSVVPLETEFGRKRSIDQSTCNGDLSCVNGFCPALVTVKGARLRKPRLDDAWDDTVDDLPEPDRVEGGEPYDILITGIGGTGIMTAGALLGMAAHLDGKAGTVLDLTGMAQKGGAATAHVRISARPEEINATRIPIAAHALIGCDITVATETEAMDRSLPNVTHAVINTARAAAGEFTANPDLPFPTGAMETKLTKVLGEEHTAFIDMSGLANRLFGEAIATNVLMLGFAFQKGLLPLSAGSIERAIELNGVAIETTKAAFLWGRRAGAWPDRVTEILAPNGYAAGASPNGASGSLDAIIDRRARFLAEYQDNAYARRYRDTVVRVRQKEADIGLVEHALSEAVAHSYFKLLAYKDEYEVARLHADPAFHRRLADSFDGKFEVSYHLAPPLTARRNSVTGRIEKRRFGRWMRLAFKILARCRRLRGTAFDPFGRSHDRRVERRLIADFEARLEAILAAVNRENHATAVEIAAVPQSIRGFGHVKDASIAAARESEAALLAEFEQATSR